MAEITAGRDPVAISNHLNFKFAVADLVNQYAASLGPITIAETLRGAACEVYALTNLPAKLPELKAPNS